MREQNCLNARQPASAHRRVLGAVHFIQYVVLLIVSVYCCCHAFTCFFCLGRCLIKQEAYFINQGRYFKLRGACFINWGRYFIKLGVYSISWGAYFINAGDYFINQGGYFINMGSYSTNRGGYSTIQGDSFIFWGSYLHLQVVYLQTTVAFQQTAVCVLYLVLFVYKLQFRDLFVLGACCTEYGFNVNFKVESYIY